MGITPYWFYGYGPQGDDKLWVLECQGTALDIVAKIPPPTSSKPPLDGKKKQSTKKRQLSCNKSMAKDFRRILKRVFFPRERYYALCWRWGPEEKFYHLFPDTFNSGVSSLSNNQTLQFRVIDIYIIFQIMCKITLSQNRSPNRSTNIKQG